MAKITTIIPAQAFEVVRDKIALILIDEIENQAGISYRKELDAKVTIERFIPYDEADLPAVNVVLARGDFDNQTTIDSDGTYRYNIDIYHKAKSKAGSRGDTLAMLNLQALLGVCRAILESSQYKTLGFDDPFIMNRHVENIVIAEPADKKDTISIVQARITFIVTVPEKVDATSADLIAGFDTQVKLGLTEKGYIYKGDNIPVPPVTGGAVTVNSDAFGNVDPGDTLNVPVENTYGDELGSLIGGKWIIANQQYTDTDLVVKFVPAGNPIVCSPISIPTLTCQQLNNGLIQTQRQLIQRVNLMKTGATVSYAGNDDAAENKGRLVNFLTLDCNNSFGNTNRFTDSVGGQVYGAGNSSIADYMIDHATGFAWQFDTGFTAFALTPFATALSNATSHNNGTFLDFIIPNINQLFSLANFGTPTILQYAPINSGASFFIWSSTTTELNTLFAHIMPAAIGITIQVVDKTISQHSIYVRNHF